MQVQAPPVRCCLRSSTFLDNVCYAGVTRSGWLHVNGASHPWLRLGTGVEELLAQACGRLE